MSKILQFSFELARHWMKERGISCMALSVEFIYLITTLVAIEVDKRTRNNTFAQLWGTTNSLMLVFKFAYVGEFTSRRRRVGVGEFARRRVDRIPSCRFLRDGSRFSRESLKHWVWHISRVRNHLFVKIVALQFNGKSMGPSNGRYVYMYALIVRSIHIKQTSNVRSDKY